MTSVLAKWIMTLGWGFVISMGLCAIGGAYAGLQDRFGRNVIAGFRAYREERRRWATVRERQREWDALSISEKWQRLNAAADSHKSDDTLPFQDQRRDPPRDSQRRA